MVDVDELGAAEGLRTPGYLDGASGAGRGQVGSRAESLGGEDVHGDRSGAAKTDVPVSQVGGTHAVDHEPGRLERGDDGADGAGGRADVGEDVAVLADLRGDATVLKGVEQDHLAADDGPGDGELFGQVEQDVPPLVHG